MSSGYYRALLRCDVSHGDGEVVVRYWYEGEERPQVTSFLIETLAPIDDDEIRSKVAEHLLYEGPLDFISIKK